VTAKAVSLAAELAALARAVDGIAALLGGDEPGDLPEDRQRTAVALLGLVGERLALVRRVVVGAEGARAILAAFNAAEPPLPGDDPDITIPIPGEGGRREGRR
jgi:hypothetical protein